MAKQHINTGQTPNDKSGDVLRTAFTKVNANFDELYSTIGPDVLIPTQTGNDGKYLTTNGTVLSWAPGASVTTSSTAPTGPALGDLWFDTVSGRTYVYYDNNWVDSSPADTLVVSSLVNGGNTVSLGSDGKLTLPNGVKITPIAFAGIDLEVATKIWNFGTDGKLTLPLQGKIGPTDVNSFLTFNWGDDVELKAGDNLFLSGGVATIRTNSNANQWTFGTDGTVTFPNGALKIAGNTISNLTGVGTGLVAGSQLEVALAKTVITHGTTNTLGDPGSPSLTSQYLVEVGTNGILNAFQVINTLDDTTLTNELITELNSDGFKIGTRITNDLGGGSPPLIGFSGWNFDAGNSRLTLPVDSSILTNETALNIATHSTTTYTFNQAYWEALNGNTARIFTPTFNAQYFACTVTANQNGTYTAAVTNTGVGFVQDNWFKIPGNELGGTTPANDMQITVATVNDTSGILTTTVTGTAVSKQWQFGTTGSLTLPDNSVIASYKPVTVIAATTTAQTITDGASAAFIQFIDTVDTANAFSTGTFTVPYTGYYQINMSIYFSSLVVLTPGSFLVIDTNLDNTKQVMVISGQWPGIYLPYSTIIPATAGDAIRIAFRQVSGADITIASGSRLTIHRVSIS